MGGFFSYFFGSNNQNEVPRGPNQAPPGPKGVPLVGSLFDMKGSKSSLEWTKRNGPIYVANMGSKNILFLNTVDLVEKYMEGKEGEAYLDRPIGPGAIGNGLLFGSGEAWKKNKAAIMNSIHTDTFDQDMEDAVQSEVQLVLDTLKTKCKCDKPVKIGDFFLGTCANSIVGLLLGGCLPKISPERKELLEVAKNLEGCDLSSMMTEISLKYPRLREPLSKLMFTNIVDINGTSRRLQLLLRQWIRQTRSGELAPKSPTPGAAHKSNPEGESCLLKKLKPNASKDSQGHDVPGGTTDPDNIMTPPHNEELLAPFVQGVSHLVAFGFGTFSKGEVPFERPESPRVPTTPYTCTPITEHRWTGKKRKSGSAGNQSILKRILEQPEFRDVTEDNDAELLQSLIDLFFGGVTSTLSGLEFVLAYLTRHPGMQQLAREEIDEIVIQNDGIISWSLKDKMPYVRACITEALRLGSVIPSSLPHVATQNTEIEGFKIQAGTYIVGGLMSIHHDPAVYLDPNEFRPQRHMNPRREFTPPKSYRPWGVGARHCVGENMASMQLFLYTVYLLRHYELRQINNKPPCLETHMRMINRLKNFQCVLHKRNVAAET